MKILCVNQFYWPDVAATGQLLQDLCEELSLKGHRVTVLAGLAGYSGASRLLRREAHNGVAILRRGASGANRKSLAARVWGYLSFYGSAFLAMMAIQKPDIILVESTPPLIVAAGAMVSILRRIPLVHVVQDLYPEVAEELGAIRKDGLAAKAFRRLHRRALSRASKIIVLGRDMRDKVAASYGVDPARIEIVANWADIESLDSSIHEAEKLRREWGIEGKKVVMYSGNLGRVHLFEEVMAVAERWRARQDVVFLCIGSGPGWGFVAKEKERRKLDNVILKGYQDRRLLGASLACGDVHLITQKPETLGLVVPSKLYGVMAVGRPVVYVGPQESEVALTLKECQAGLVVAPGDVAGLEAALAAYLDEPERASGAGMAGRERAIREFSKAAATARYEAIVQSVVAR